MDILIQFFAMAFFFASLMGYIVGANIVSNRICDKLDKRKK